MFVGSRDVSGSGGRQHGLGPEARWRTWRPALRRARPTRRWPDRRGGLCAQRSFVLVAGVSVRPACSVWWGSAVGAGPFLVCGDCLAQPNQIPQPNTHRKHCPNSGRYEPRSWDCCCAVAAGVCSGKVCLFGCVRGSACDPRPARTWARASRRCWCSWWTLSWLSWAEGSRAEASLFAWVRPHLAEMCRDPPEVAGRRVPSVLAAASRPRGLAASPASPASPAWRPRRLGGSAARRLGRSGVVVFERRRGALWVRCVFVGSPLGDGRSRGLGGVG